MKILFAVDGSPQALAALETLVEKFGYFRETPRLTLIHVHPPVPYQAAETWVGKETIERYYDEESEAALAGALGCCRRAASRSKSTGAWASRRRKSSDGPSADNSTGSQWARTGTPPSPISSWARWQREWSPRARCPCC
jgi:hypothetical protein